MAIRVRRVDTGAINTQAFNNFIGTITQLKGQQRDREITTGLAKIERTSQLALDIAANDPILSDDEKLVEIQKIRQAARISKLDMLTQTGDFSPPQSRGIGGFLGRLAGAFDPTDTRGVTQSPMTQAIQGRLVQQNFPTVSEQARADATRIASRRRVTAVKPTVIDTLDEITKLEGILLDLEDKIEIGTATEGDVRTKQSVEAQIAARQEIVNKASGVVADDGKGNAGELPPPEREKDKTRTEKALGTGRAILESLAKFGIGSSTGPGVGAGAVIRLGKEPPPAKKRTKPPAKKRTKTGRDRLQGVFELMTDKQKAEAQEKLKQGKTPEEIVTGFLAALAAKPTKEMTVEELRFQKERLQ